jgi:hypothetical protein
MLDFISFLGKRDEDLYYHHLEVVLERSVAEVESNPPKDGAWIDNNHFGFNVEGDEEGLRENQRRYMVAFGGLPNTSISFSREGSYGDHRGGFGTKVFDGVFYAIWEFIKKNNPRSISWSPIQRTSANPVKGKITNPAAREKAYEIFSIKSLFPDYYVSTQPNQWISRSVYDNEYVPKGYPAIPEGLTVDSNPGAKKKFLEMMRAKQKELNPVSLPDDDDDTSAGSNARNLSGGFQWLVPELTPANEEGVELVGRNFGFRVGEKVLPKVLENTWRTTSASSFHNLFPYSIHGLNQHLQDLVNARRPIQGKIKQILEYVLNGERQYALKVEFQENGPEFSFYVHDVSPYSDQEANKIAQAISNPLDVAIADRRLNYHGYRVNSRVVHEYGYIGTITRIDFEDPRNPMHGLKMEIRWNPQESLPGAHVPDTTIFPLDDGRVRLATPQNINWARQNIQYRADAQRRDAERAQAARSRPYNPLDDLRHED